MAEFNELIKIFKDAESQELSDVQNSEAHSPDLVDPTVESSTKATVGAPMTSDDSSAGNGGQHTICTKCKHANPADSNFCVKCGGRLGYVCAHCKANLPEGAKFCNHCGHEVAAQAMVDVVATLKRGECVNLQAMIDNFEKLLIETAMDVAEGNMSRAAQLLQIHRTTLYSRIQSKLQK